MADQTPRDRKLSTVRDALSLAASVPNDQDKAVVALAVLERDYKLIPKK